ncbi:MAG: FMN-binding protein [Gammaproteobacteria bacterium]|nr:FMN-binding protein [Gammaproteobacteria bacterium]MBU1446678.1 FMN-binding protein [Gammaproteobacteria bacterium]
MVRTLMLVTSLCGGLIVAVWQLTQPAIAANKKVVLERSVRALIPNAAQIVEYDASTRGVTPGKGDPADGAVRFYAAYDRHGQLEAIAAEGAARGYTDTVRVLYGYRRACECIFGIRVTQMKETPGIGDKIITDPVFLKNFESLDVSLTPDMRSLFNTVKTVKHGTKQFGWEIDAIAGATITSKAVGRGINDSAQRLLPLLVPNLEAISQKGGMQ